VQYHPVTFPVHVGLHPSPSVVLSSQVSHPQSWPSPQIGSQKLGVEVSHYQPS